METLEGLSVRFQKKMVFTGQIKMTENNECKHHAMHTIKQLNYRIANH